MRDRLIELLCGHYMNTTSDATEVADYLLENGVIVPPCKVGEIVWVNNKYGTMPAKVYQITQTFYGCFMVNLHYDLSYCYNNRINTNGAVGYTEDKFEFGETAYHTKEEAEARLKGGEG